MEWFKKLKMPEKVMLGLIIMLLVSIALRWQFIKQEGGESIKNRVSIDTQR